MYVNILCVLLSLECANCVVLCKSQLLIVALVPWLPHKFPVGWFINSFFTHVVFGISTNGRWHNLSGTSSDGWDGLLEQVAFVLATQRQEKLFVNNLKKCFLKLNSVTIIYMEIVSLFVVFERQANEVCGAFNTFPDFFEQTFKIVVDTWKFSMLLLYILWDYWPTFMISGSNEQLQQELEYTLLKPDCHSWWISKMQSGREDTLEERYAIKFCFKLGKMPQKRMECLRLPLEHLAWIEHQFLSGIRDSRKAGNLWGMMRSVGGVRKSIDQSWLA